MPRKSPDDVQVSRRIASLVGTRLREARADAATQAIIANVLGVTRSSVSNMEKGRHRIFLDQAYLICRTLRLELSDVLPTVDEVFSGDAVLLSPGLEDSDSHDDIEKVARKLASRRTREDKS